MVTDAQIRSALKVRLEAGSGADTRVLKRWKLAVDNRDWKGALRSLTANNLIDGWFITRVGARSTRLGFAKWEYEWDYDLWYFRSVREGTADDNSEYEVNALIDAVAAQFEAAPTLAFSNATDGVDRHSEMQIRSIDIIEDQIHVVQCRLTVYLTRQP